MSAERFNVGLDDCGHASHGSFIKGCRCDACMAANASYERERRKRKAYGRPLMVDAEPVREHVMALIDAGMSRKEICRITGIGHTTLDGLTREHWRTGKPVAMMLKANADSLMRITRRDLRPGQRVSSEAVRLLVSRWTRAGISVAHIARTCGMDRQRIERVKRNDLTTFGTLMAVLDHKEELDDLAEDMRRPRGGSTKAKKVSRTQIVESTRPTRTVTCPVCGRRFETNESARRYCCKECRDLARNRRRKAS